jgi:predicted lipoprotein with Yx(FWY)xxD motif
MRKSMNILIPTLAASLLLSACGSSSSSKSSAETSSQPASSPSSASNAVVKTASNTKLGATVLVDAQGMTLYHLSVEQNGKFICTSSCTGIWHPLTVAAGSTPAGTASLGTVKRPEGTEQVTYKGSPLYTFAQDTAEGDVKGQGIKDVGTWSAATTSASSAAAPATTTTSSTPAAAPATTSSTPSSSGGGGYKY